jgi:hypothetical protein
VRATFSRFFGLIGENYDLARGVCVRISARSSGTMGHTRAPLHGVSVFLLPFPLLRPSTKAPVLRVEVEVIV